MAGCLGRELGWPVLGKQLVDRVAERFHVDRSIVEMLDETRSNFLYEVFGQFFNHHLVGQVSYVCCLRRTVLAAVSAGPVVVVGRGAQYFLPRSCGLAVRVVADERDRIERIRRQHAVTRVEARRVMAEVQDQRTSFVRTYFHHDTDDAENYDLVVNTSRIGIESAAQLVAEALRSRQLVLSAVAGPCP
jgi:cytidylate kinase